MNYTFDEEYNVTDKYSIEEYSQKMIGQTFQDLIDNDQNNSIISSSDFVYGEEHENKKRKGGLGELVEERFFHYKANNDSDPDFKEAGVELKVSPYKINKNNTLSAKERTVLTMIDFNSIVNESDFYNSHLWHKSQLILYVFYLYKENQNRLDYRIDFSRLFTPPEEDLNIIKQDYEKIKNKIKEGKAHELSESDTMYVGACTKSSDSSKRTTQPNSDVLAKPRAFAYKNSYVTYVLNNYIVGKKPLYESLTAHKSVDNFEEYIINKLDKYIGRSKEELRLLYGSDLNVQSKSFYSSLTFRMLGIKSNNAEEFEKANIVIKTIRLNKAGKINENMSFPKFVFNEVANQDWEDSDFYHLLSETKFLFVVYQENEDGDYIFCKSLFWNMPYSDLDNEVRVVWEKTKYVLNNLPEKIHDGNKYISIFPKQTENPICHVRPHAKDSKDVDILPDGRVYPKQCFWLSKTYILSIINKK